MRRLLVIITIAIIFLVSGGSVLSEFNSNIIPDKVLAAAKEGLNTAKEKFSRNPENWGFSSADEVSRLQLGNGYRINYINPEKLSKSNGSDISSLIDTSMIETWLFTLDIGDRARTYLIIAPESGKYEAVSFGGDAGIFGTAANVFKQITKANGMETTPRIVQVSLGYFMIYEINGQEFALPVYNNEEAILTVNNVNQLKSISEIIADLQIIQKTAVKGKRGDGMIIYDSFPMNKSFPAQNNNLFESVWFKVSLSVLLFSLLLLVLKYRRTLYYDGNKK